MPVVFNEPLTMLQRACEGIQHSDLLRLADQSDDPVIRMELVCAFIIASISPNCHRIVKPFNPLLYETYEFEHKLEDNKEVRAIAQQVSHHPPITAVNCESEYFAYSGIVNPKIKFWGRSVEVSHDGSCQVYLKRHNETYVFKAVPCSLHNIIVGKLWFEHHGPLDVRCVETNVQANLVLRQTGWFSNDVHRFDGFITTPGGEPKKQRFVYGKWSDYIKSVDYKEYEKYMEQNQQKLFRIPDNPDENGQEGELSSKLNELNVSANSNSINNNSIPSERGDNGTKSSTKSKSLFKGNGKKTDYTKSESIQSLDIPNSKILWKLEAKYLEEYYNFTQFTMRMNDLNPELEKKLPRTDSRFRPDVRRLEEGDIDAAANEKQRLEEKQREIRSRDKRFKDPHPDFLWFEFKDVPYSKEKTWLYRGGYWENRCNQEKFPDLF